MGSLVAELAEKLSAATNNLDFDEQTMFLNTSANTVGIGTNAPASKLDVRGTMQIGVDDTGHDVIFYGATAGSNMTWDESIDSLKFTDDASAYFGDGSDARIHTDGTTFYIRSELPVKIATEYSGMAVTIGHTTSETTIQDNATITGTLTQTGVATFAVRSIHSGGITLANGEQIGSVGDPDSITISTAGVVTMTQIPVFSAGINVSGGTIAGTLATAAQGTVTSLGTLTGLTVNGAAVFNENSANDIDFRVEGATNANLFFVDGSADRIGIGTNDPGAHVDIRGPAGSGSATPGVLMLSTAETTVVDGDYLGKIDFRAPLEGSGTDATLVGASIWAEADDTFATDNNATELVFATGASETAAEKVRITSDGKVGIGTTAPASALHVAGTMQVGVNGTGHDCYWYGDTAGSHMHWDESIDSLRMTSDASIYFGDGSEGRIHNDSTYTYFRSEHPFKLATETSGVAITIGHTTSETTVNDNLTVTGNIAVTGTGLFSADGAQVFNESGADVDFRVESDDNVYMIFVDGGNDRVGIGTSAPGKTLDVFDPSAAGDNIAARFRSNFSGTAGQGVGIEFADASPTIFAKIACLNQADSNRALVFYTGSGGTPSEHMRINHAGFVGIGTTLPTTNLHVHEDGTAFSMLVQQGNGQGNALDVFASASDDDSNDLVKFRTDDKILFVLENGGNCGIGNSAPGNRFVVGPYSGEPVAVEVMAGEGKAGWLYLKDDEGDDNDDKWLINNTSAAGNQDPHMYFTTNDGNWDNRMAIGSVTNVWCEGSFNGGGADYAEFFEWKEELADEAEVKSLFGMTVVLEGGKIRIAQAGEEDDILGVVRPNDVSTTGNHPQMRWNDKYSRDAFGTILREPYIQVDWYVIDEKSNKTRRYQYMKDRIPEYEMIDHPDESRIDWETIESNFKKDADGDPIPLKVPTTNAEKTAHNYTERSEFKEHKGGDRGGDPLTRRVLNPDFDPSQEYISRDERRTEWCIVGLLGMVPVRDTAVIPTHWVKMKNIESGIDMYYIK